MNIGDLFDSPLKLAIIAILIIVLFGSKKLPGAARSLGQSMRILKREVQGLHEDEPESSTAPPAQAQPAGELTATPAAPAAPAAPSADQQSRIDDLEQKIRDLQRATAMDPVASGQDPRVNQQS